MNDILGGAFTSRINMNLREDKTWSYGADTTVVDTQAQRPFLAIAPVQADKTARRCARSRTSFEEFVGRSRRHGRRKWRPARRLSTLTLPGRWETARAVAKDIAALVRFKLPDDYWNRLSRNSSQAHVSVKSTPRRSGCSHPDRLTWVVVGDRGVIEAEVRALGFGEITVIDADGKRTSP